MNKAPNSKTVQRKQNARKAIALELNTIQQSSVEGFLVKLLNDDNIFEWEVAIFGPPETIYEGGYFKAHMKFPNNYPSSPPRFRFVTRIWHPNVFIDGELCISILPRSNLTTDKWNPVQTVTSILISIISLLTDPNVSSPANIFASNMYKSWKDSNGEDKVYEGIVRSVVEKSKLEAKKDGVVVPTTVEDYCVKRPIESNAQVR